MIYTLWHTADDGISAGQGSLLSEMSNDSISWFYNEISINKDYMDYHYYVELQNEEELTIFLLKYSELLSNTIHGVSL